MPGGGSCVSAITVASSKKPLTTGKPNPYIIDILCNKYGIKKEESLMIGDNMETDIKFGKNAGLDTYLVLTGVTNE